MLEETPVFKNSQKCKMQTQNAENIENGQIQTKN